MGKDLKFAAATTCLLATAMVAPPAAGAAGLDGAPDADADADVAEGKSPTRAVAGLSAEQVGGAERYLADNGVPPEEIDGFAEFLDVDVDELYRLVDAEIAETGGGKVDAPVEMVDGKVRYNNTAVDDLPPGPSRTSTQQGTAARDGSCSFPPIEVDTTLGQHVLSEVTELDPEDCTRVIESAGYDPARWNEPTPGARIAGDSFIPGFSCKSGNIQTAPPTLFQPNRQWLDGEHRRYYKQAFVDPICISITSTTLNVSWKNQINSWKGVTLIDRERRNYYFTQLGEEWINKSTTLSPSVEPTHRANEVYATLLHTRTETDFPEHLAAAAAAFGAGIPGIGIIGSLAAVWAACGFNLGDTHFSSWQQLELRRNGGHHAVGWGNVTGGCSNLVHEQVWHGGGVYAR